jgi:hypothetical protein
MRAIWWGIAGLVGALALSACIAGGGTGGSGKTSAPNPITGGEIEVTALEEAPAAPGPAAAAKPTDLAVKPGDAAEKPPEEPTPTKPKPLPDEAEATTEAEDIPPPEPAEVVPEVEKSAAQIACERKGNMWSKAGASGASACVKRTKDGGKRCMSGKDCDGDCLARSNTCAPFTPLFGCNEILQDDGVRMTLCLD